MAAPDVQAMNINTDNARDASLNNLDEEDCAYLLKSLELDAFSSVVNAMRAQGMLTEYKEILLDHLKSALFISDSFYKAEIRRATDDDVLSRIAQTLNPSYDTYTEWCSAGGVQFPASFGNIPLYDEQDLEGLDVADQLLKLANSHNSAIDNAETALLELIELPKAPFVPEKLRAILRETESIAEERTDFPLRAESPAVKKQSISSTAKRGRKAHNDGSPTFSSETVFTDDEKHDRQCAIAFEQGGINADGVQITEKESDEVIPVAENISAVINAEQKSDQNTDTGAVEVDSMVCGDGGFVLPPRPSSVLSPPAVTPSSFSAAAVPLQRPTIMHPNKIDTKKGSFGSDEADVMASEEDKPKRRRSKPRDNASCVCARVLPFIFEAVAPGQKVKPPRGNPDRRTAKRASPTSAPAFASSAQLTNSSSNGVMPQPLFSTSVPSSSRSIPLLPSTPSPMSRLHSATSQHAPSSPGLLIKRARTTSANGEQGSSSESGGIVYARSLVSASNINKGQTSGPRTYMRPATATKFFVSSSQAASAYSNPARPYYGNPSAAAMGITVRGATLGGGVTTTSVSAPSSISEKLPHSPQNGQLGEVQHMVGHDYSTTAPVLLPASHQQIKTLRRSSFSSTKPGYAIGGSFPTRMAPVVNGVSQGSAGAHAQLLQSSLGPSTHGTTPIGSHSAIPSPSSASGRLSAFSAACSQSSMHLSAHQTLNHSHPSGDALAAANPILQDEQGGNIEETFAMVERMNDDAAMTGGEAGSSLSEGVRLECDEVMIPEQRCVITTIGSTSIAPHRLNHHIAHTSSISPRGQSLSLMVDYAGEDEIMPRGHRLIPQEYVNAVMHHDGHDTVGLVPTGQCIR
uniref:ENT domain-containing protein n=3 Tax=Parascaris univalens TaxID=6257 RepID=A0A914ZF86_PARUN